MEAEGGGGAGGGGALGRGASQRGLSGGKPPKKLTISLKKEKPQLPQNFEQDTWDRLKECVTAVHTQQPVTQSFEQLYKGVEDLCIHKKGESLYERLAAECESHIQRNIAGLVNQTPDPVLFLELAQSTWDAHCNRMSTIRSIFLYLDRTYVIQSGDVVSLWEMGLIKFRRHLEEAHDVQRKTLAGLLTLIHKERTGDMVNRSLVRNLLRMLSSLGLYPQFEGKFLEASEDFYRDEAQQKLQELDVPHYMLYVERRIEEEGDRVGQYLDPQTRKPLVAKLDHQLLESHVTAIVDKGFESLMADAEQRVEDLKRMYVLLGRVNALASIKGALSGYVRKTGVEMVANEERDKDLVSDLLAFKELLDSLLEQAFFGNEELSHALKDSFEVFINVRQNKPAELIAKFVDLQLRGGGEGTNDFELEALLDRVMTLFRYIQGKDVFEAFFKKDLAKRLLLGKSGSVDAEKSMISKLKQECGSSFTNKLEGMFKDMELSRDVMIAYADSSIRTSLVNKLDSELQIHVLTTGYWPPYPPAPLNIPRDLAQHQEAFEKFYLSKHQGRRLAWQNSLGHSTVKAHLGEGKGRREHMLQVSLYQCAILLLFNTADELSYEEIKDAVGMEEKELRVTLQSLACAKIKIITKTPKGRDVNEGDKFNFNYKFESKQLRIKVNSIQLKETQEENDKTTETVFQDRQYQVDAAVVRVMKARKSLAHTLLISELFKLLKFPVTPADLKKRIESLIEREYLERDKDHPTVYNYLA